MSSPDMAGILDNSKELDRLRKEREEFLLEINMIHKKLQTTPEVVEMPGDDSYQRLRCYILHMSHIIPFPKRTELSSVPHFLPGKQVLAIYLETAA